MKPIKFNPNDPKLWKDFDPTEKSKEFIDDKSEGDIKRISKNRIRSTNPILEEQRITALQEAVNTDKWKQGQIERGKIVSEKYIADIDNRKKLLKEGWNKPGVREAKSLSAKEVANRPEVKEILLKHIHKRAKKQMVPIVTREGIFPCAQAWANVVKKDKAMFGHWASKFPKEYYRISQEEYIMLTGENPFKE